MTSQRFPYDTEQLKVDQAGIVSMRLNVATGEDEHGHFICFAPAINVSGYGSSKEEASESFNENIQTFIEDMTDLSQSKRSEYLLSLGWKKNPYFKKQFSKVYIDDNGELQGFKIKEISALETAH